jgi:hypothetical protein
MKHSLLSGCLTIVVVLMAGCQEVEKPADPEPRLMPLPEHVAGTWQARESDWRIVLDPNGTVGSALIPLGKVWVSPNKITKVEMKDGSFSTYEGGDCVAKYDPLKGELYVLIEVANLDIRYLDQQITGNSTDRFIGLVSEDGKKWTTDWITQFDYGPRFPQDENDVYGGILIFDKVKEEADPNEPAEEAN